MKFQISSILDKVQYYIQDESFIFLWLLLALSFVFYKLFLKEISNKRHLNLQSRFKSSFIVLGLSSALALAHWLSFEKSDLFFIIRLSHLAAVGALASGAIALIKQAQILAYLYLFFKNMSQGIPRLVVNLFTILFSLFVFSYLASEVFSIHVTALLATSAVFSLVLGLALQDTLGNLFSGVAMQIGQPFKIGDWVEITLDAKKWTGQIQEITWRATFLSSFADEWMMIPNKSIAQSEIIILTNPHKILRHSQMFRIDFAANLAVVKSVILDSMQGIPEILADPAPSVLLIETAESWMTVKVFYSMSDYSKKFRVSDQVISTILENFKKNNIQLATHRVQLASV